MCANWPCNRVTLIWDIRRGATKPRRPISTHWHGMESFSTDTIPTPCVRPLGEHCSLASTPFKPVRAIYIKMVKDLLPFRSIISSKFNYQESFKPFSSGFNVPTNPGEPSGIPLNIKLLPQYLKDRQYNTFMLGKVLYHY